MNQHVIVHWSGDYRTIIEDPAIDVVTIRGPNATHAEIPSRRPGPANTSSARTQ